MKTHCIMLVLLALVVQGCSSLGPYRARNGLITRQLNQDIDRIAAGPQLSLEKQQALIANSPVVIFENTTNQWIDLRITDLRHGRQQPLAFKIGPGRIMVLPRDKREVSGFFHFEESYQINFGYVGRGQRRVYIMRVNAAGAWYDTSSLDDDQTGMVWCHGSKQFRRGGIALYNY